MNEDLAIVYESDAEMNDDFVSESKEYHDSTYMVISRMAYLLGVPKNIFENEHTPPKMEIYEKMDGDKNARIIRNLCLIRTAIERNYGRLNQAFIHEMKNIHSVPDMIPTEAVDQLLLDGIDLYRANGRLNQYLVDINSHISNRINNCKTLIPIWLKWEYVRELFIMPGGTKEANIKQAADEYYANISSYPYQIYMNWQGSWRGNILGSDKKFVGLLYEAHEDYFSDMSKVTDAGVVTKSGIYQFLERSGKTAVVVDCENSDPYKLYAMLNNLNQEALLEKIAKIILFDDVHTTTAWQILNEFTDIPVERVLIERIKENKSLVDIRLTTGTCREFFQNNTDSFILASSDSDYWGLIPAMPEAHFLVLIESMKCSPLIRKAMDDQGITYCYIDDFCTGNSTEIKEHALLRELNGMLSNEVNFNIQKILDKAFENTRAEMSAAEKRQFYNRYIKPIHLEIDGDGNILVALGKV